MLPVAVPVTKLVDRVIVVGVIFCARDLINKAIDKFDEVNLEAKWKDNFDFEFNGKCNS